MIKPLVFIVEPEEALLQLFNSWLIEWQFETMIFAKLSQIVSAVQKSPNAILIDLKSINSEDKSILKPLIEKKTPVILIAHYTNYDLVEKNNYFDICPFPVEPNHLRQTIKNATNFNLLIKRFEKLRKVVEGEDTGHEFITRDEDLLQLSNEIRNKAGHVPIIIAGEISTGKSTLIENVLNSDKKLSTHYFHFERNNVSDLQKLTDENDILEIDLPFSNEILSKNLVSEIIKYPRENVFIFPPLRRRPADIDFFRQYFSEQFMQMNENRKVLFTNDAMQKLLNYNWPGNLLEFKIIIQKAILSATAEQIDADNILISPNEQAGEIAKNTPIEEEKMDVISFDAVKKQTVINAYDQCKGNIFEASRRLKIGRATMYRLLHKYGVI